MIFLKKIAVCILLTAANTQLIAQQHGLVKKYNILFLLTDDQRATTIHALGNKEIITPNMDELVKNGTAFTHAYIMGGAQGAVCAPSRAMIMTGKYVYHLAGDGSTIPAKDIQLGEWLQQKGYDAHGIGKWHNGPDSYARNFSSGADIFFGGMSDHFNIPVWKFDSTRQYKADSIHGQPHINAGKNASELFADDAIAYLQRADKKPFFLYVAFTSPHDPRTSYPEYTNLYDTAKISLPVNFMPQHPFDNGELKVRDELLAALPRTAEEIKLHLRDYYAMITHLDNQVGRIIKALKESGQYDNTIIVFAGDNGLALGQHGLMGKQNVYEHSVNIPLIISGPGIPKNQRRNAFVYLLDIFPTLCELTGVQKPATVDGSSLVNVIKDGNKKVRQTAYFRYREFQRAVRNEQYKLIEYNVAGKRTTQLFDLKNDPAEINNLFNDVAYHKQLILLRRQLLQSKATTGDDGVFWNGYRDYIRQ